MAPRDAQAPGLASPPPALIGSRPACDQPAASGAEPGAPRRRRPTGPARAAVGGGVGLYIGAGPGPAERAGSRAPLRELLGWTARPPQDRQPHPRTPHSAPQPRVPAPPRAVRPRRARATARLSSGLLPPGWRGPERPRPPRCSRPWCSRRWHSGPADRGAQTPRPPPPTAPWTPSWSAAGRAWWHAPWLGSPQPPRSARRRPCRAEPETTFWASSGSGVSTATWASASISRCCPTDASAECTQTRATVSGWRGGHSGPGFPLGSSRAHGVGTHGWVDGGSGGWMDR